MRISQDTESWKASGVLRRDFRHTHDGPEIPRGRHKIGRPRNEWCRGKIGRDHTLERYTLYYSYDYRYDPYTGERSVVRVPAMSGYRCARCGTTDLRRVPLRVIAIVDPVVAEGLRLSEQWCGDGHLFDNLPAPARYSPLWGHTTRACVMCGWNPSGWASRYIPVSAPARLVRR